MAWIQSRGLRQAIVSRKMYLLILDMGRNFLRNWGTIGFSAKAFPMELFGSFV